MTQLSPNITKPFQTCSGQTNLAPYKLIVFITVRTSYSIDKVALKLPTKNARTRIAPLLLSVSLVFSLLQLHRSNGGKHKAQYYNSAHLFESTNSPTTEALIVSATKRTIKYARIMIAISLIKMSLERPHFPTPPCFQLPKQAVDMSILTESLFRQILYCIFCPNGQHDEAKTNSKLERKAITELELERAYVWTWLLSPQLIFRRMRPCHCKKLRISFLALSLTW